MSRLPLRLRVALAFAVTSALVLVGLGFFVYLRVESTLNQQTEVGLLTRLEVLARAPEAARTAAVTDMTGEAFAQVLSSDRTVVASSPQISATPLAPATLPAVGRIDTFSGTVAFIDEGESESATFAAQRLDDQIVVVGSSRESVQDALDQLRTQLTIAIPLALAAAAAIGFVVAGRALSPVRDMTTRAEHISAKNSADRLPIPAADDEIRSLGNTLNAMLDRLDEGLQRERRFVAEASHELRTPLALLRMELDLALARARSPEELRAALRSAGEEVDRLTQLAQELLDLAAIDAADAAQAAPVNVASLLGEVKQHYQGAALDEGRTLVVEADPTLVCSGERALLIRVFDNVADNALRHGAGAVVLRAAKIGDDVSIDVVDEGPGLAADVQGAEFDPFRRSAETRAWGSGLGLSIVKVIVEQHGGHVSTAKGVNGGATVTVVLPGTS